VRSEIDALGPIAGQRPGLAHMHAEMSASRLCYLAENRANGQESVIEGKTQDLRTSVRTAARYNEVKVGVHASILNERAVRRGSTVSVACSCQAAAEADMGEAGRAELACADANRIEVN
jgi:hypothetical protein